MFGGSLVGESELQHSVSDPHGRDKSLFTTLIDCAAGILAGSNAGGTTRLRLTTNGGPDAVRKQAALYNRELARSEARTVIHLTHDPIDYHALTESVRRPDCGAVALFLGTVRDLTDGKATVALDYEAYPGMAEKKLVEIEADTRARWAVGAVAMIHRLGHLEVGEVSVAVAVSSAHRNEAFAACRHAIDRLKELVPIWKKENWADGSTEWVHPHGLQIENQRHSEDGV